MVLSVRVVWNDVLVSPVVNTVSSVARTLLSEVVDLFATGVESLKDIETTFIVFTVQGERVVTSVQVVVWIGDFSAIVEVWIDVDSVTFVGQSGFTFTAFAAFLTFNTFASFFALVGWATSITNSWYFFESVEVVIVFLGGTFVFGWFSAFFSTFARFFEASAASVLIFRPDISLIGITSEIVGLWTIATAYSSVATAIKVIDSDFTFFAWSEVFNRSSTDRTRFVSVGDPSLSTGTSDVFTGINWVAFDGVDWFTVAVIRTIASFFLFFDAMVFTIEFSSSVIVTSTFASLAVIAFFVPNFSVRFLGSVNDTFSGFVFWWFTSNIFFVDSVDRWELSQESHDGDWVDLDGTLIVAVVTIASTAKTESTLGIRGGVRDRPFLMDWVVFDGKFEFGEVESDISTLFGGRVTGFVGDVVFGSKVEDFDSVV
jgi:hypothetical protein